MLYKLPALPIIPETRDNKTVDCIQERERILCFAPGTKENRIDGAEKFMETENEKNSLF